MTQQNGKVSPLTRVARDVRHVAHDVVELTELQTTLFKTELGGFWKQLVMPVVLFGLLGILVVSCTVVLLLSGAYQLVESASLSLPLALLLTGLGGLLLAAVLGTVGWTLLKKSRAPCPESARELGRNLRWIKTVLKDVVQHPATPRPGCRD